MDLTLYYAPMTCALVPYVTLLEAGASFEVEVVNFFKAEHLTAGYLKLNPKHKVPTLVIEGEPLTENTAILQWIDHQFDSAGLLPNGLNKYKAVSLMAWCASAIHPSLTPNALPQRYCDIEGSEDSVKACAQKLTHESLGVAEDLLVDRDWFFEDFSIPDIYFFWCFRRAKQFGLDVSEYRGCNEHFVRVSERQSVKQVTQFEAEVLAAWNDSK